MRLIFIRHGSPDYQTDSLLPEGILEAEALRKRVNQWKVEAFYSSPMGRARQTAEIAMRDIAVEPIILPWLEEWRGRIWNPMKERTAIPWDLYPEHWAMNPEMYDHQKWIDDAMYRTGLDNCIRIWDETKFGIDSLLAEYGYKREEGCCYNVQKAFGKSNQTIVLFCHCGIMNAMIGYLLGISTPVLWHSNWVAPTSVTVLSTDERQKGYARFMIQVMGDTRHLSDAGLLINNTGYLADVWQG